MFQSVVNPLACLQVLPIGIVSDLVLNPGIVLLVTVLCLPVVLCILSRWLRGKSLSEAILGEKLDRAWRLESSVNGFIPSLVLYVAMSVMERLRNRERSAWLLLFNLAMLLLMVVATPASVFITDSQSVPWYSSLWIPQGFVCALAVYDRRFALMASVIVEILAGHLIPGMRWFTFIPAGLIAPMIIAYLVRGLRIRETGLQVRHLLPLLGSFALTFGITSVVGIICTFFMGEYLTGIYAQADLNIMVLRWFVSDLTSSIGFGLAVLMSFNFILSHTIEVKT